jgi:rubredoxin
MPPKTAYEKYPDKNACLKSRRGKVAFTSIERLCGL